MQTITPRVFCLSEGGSSSTEEAYDGNGMDSTALSSPADEEGSQSESSHLKTRMMVLTDMNRTLRQELSVYDTLCRSMGVQVCEMFVMYALCWIVC